MPLNADFYRRVAEGIAVEDEIFKRFETENCGCAERFGYCACTNLERACRFVSKTTEGVFFFNREQREILISQSVYQSEGGYSTEEVEKLSDTELAKVWLETANDYVNSQL